MIPAFPSDATIMSIHLACLRVGRAASLSTSFKSFYQGPSYVNNRFGQRANAFALGALDGCISPESLVDQHSAFPYFASQLIESVAARWRRALIEGHPDAFLRYLPATKHGLRSTHPLRHCPDCQESDVEQYGLAHWHVVHLLPGIRFCPQHNRLLHDHCRSCKTPLEANTRGTLPGDPCPRCGSHDTDSTLSKHHSDGYQSLANLTRRALQQQAPEATPTVRHRLMKHFIDTAGITATDLTERFLKWWAVETPQQLESMLEARVDTPALLQLMQEGHAKVSTPLMLAVLAFAWDHTTDSDRRALLEGYDTEKDLFSRQRPNDIPTVDLLNQLMELVQQLHLPRQVAELLSHGDRASTTDLIGRANVLSLIDGVTENARVLLVQRMREHQHTARQHNK